MEYHIQYGHVNFKDIVRLSRIDPDMPVLYRPNGKVQRLNCNTCNKCKMTGGPGKKTKANHRSAKPLGRVFIDIAGPVSSPALGGYKYFMVIVDDCTRRIFVYLLKHKYDAIHAFKHFSNQYGKADIVKSDNAGELKKGEFKEFVIHQGTT